MNVYTDPRLLDVAGALQALPELPLEGKRKRRAAGRAGVSFRWPHTKGRSVPERG